MTDAEILKKFHQHFWTNGKITIEDGLVSCTGWVELLKPNHCTALPVKFKSVGGDFTCGGNPQLTTLAGAPQTVGGHFNCINTKLTTLQGAPLVVGGDFVCRNNPQLTTLAGAPRYVGGDFIVTYNKNLPLLRLLEIKGCKQIQFNDGKDDTNQDLSAVLKRYLGKGHPGMLACAEEMHNVGYGSNALL